MKRFAVFVNPLRGFFFSRFTPHLHALFCEGANYSKAITFPARLFSVFTDRQ